MSVTDRTGTTDVRGQRKSAPARRLQTKAKTLTGPKLQLARVVFGLAMLVLWKLLSMTELVSPLIMRSPEEVGRAFIDLIVDGRLLPALWSTMEAVLVSLVIASVAGIFIGIVLGLFPRVEAIVDPYLNALNAMPRLAFAPVFIVAFGIGQTAKEALAVSLVVFILIINARAGIKFAEPDAVRLAEALGFSRVAVLRKVLLPAAVPSIFAGIRLGVIYSLLAVVGSELIAARAGLGQLIASDTAIFKMESVYAVVLVLAVLGALINQGTSVVERRLLRWQGQEVGGYER